MITLNNVNFFNHISTKNYVGIKRNSKTIDVMLPLGYPIPKSEEDRKQAVIDILDTIELAKDKSDDNLNFNLNNEDDNDFLPIASYLYLINDYLNNGLYSEKEKTFKNGSFGKINWKRTLRNKFYVSNNQAVYLDTVVEKNKAIETLITEIHILCLNISFDMLGWIFGNFEQLDCTLSLDNVDEYVQIIKYEILSTFNDNVKILLTHMLHILEYISNEGDYNNDILTHTYYYAWEKMIDLLFANQDASKFYPQGFYRINNEELNASNLRPDSILISEKTIYILDAKYYKYGVEKAIKNLPKSSSIQKQITYGEYVDGIKKKYDCNRVQNAFIIPYNKLNNPHNYCEDIKYFGFGGGNWRIDSKTYDKIALIFVDTKFLIDNYSSKKKEYINKLIAEINKSLTDK